MVFETKWYLMIYLLIYLSQGCRASYREAETLTGTLGLSQGAWAYHREAGPLTGRQGLSQTLGL